MSDISPMDDFDHITGRQLAAARALLGIGQVELASRANISAPTLRRMEASEGAAEGMRNNVASVIGVLEAGGITFLDGNYSGSGGPGVRLTQPAGASIDMQERETIQYREFYENDAPPGAGG
ncbi:helix-turn-helix domain-containing protein [Rhizobium viscosum]|uniref:Transcriptional regulator with XRE-family HTH domain n=1 Tax=Rhizobium viscosum TaxID=1673 RepID=A0ABR9II53_RHIVS|nr:helix-turn-helix transcriptional regulator [Rhizobium viscosum]MBE1502856.1 transcriptional regulator with XRE-family HTH domain [Rhizobium viscosum]